MEFSKIHELKVKLVKFHWPRKSPWPEVVLGGWGGVCEISLARRKSLAGGSYLGR